MALAPWLPHRIPTAMAHITAVLIVLTLAAEPAANALCTSWCDSSSERHVCRDAIATSVTPELSNATTTCATLLAATPFLSEDARSSRGVAAARDLPLTAAEIPAEAARGVRVRCGGVATAGRPQPLLALRV